MMKIYFVILGLLLNCSINLAQTEHNKARFEFFLKAGPIFHSFDPNIILILDSEAHNRWDLELGIYDSRIGVSILTRFITGRSFINNPIFRPSPINVSTLNLKKGDLFIRETDISNFAFLLSKNLLSNKLKKHRIDIGLGTLIRKGYNSYFDFWRNNQGEPSFTTILMDKWGLLGRIGYTYIPLKHLSLSINGEYARFKESPKDIFNFSLLVGTYF